MLVRLRSAWENKTLEKPRGWSSMRHQSLGREVASRLPCYVHLWWYYYIVMTFLEFISYPILCLLWVISPIWYDYMIFLGEWLQSFGVSLSCDVSVIPWVVNNDPCQVHQHSSKTLVLSALAWITGISCSNQQDSFLTGASVEDEQLKLVWNPISVLHDISHAWIELVEYPVHSELGF